MSEEIRDNELKETELKENQLSDEELKDVAGGMLRWRPNVKTGTVE